MTRRTVLSAFFLIPALCFADVPESLERKAEVAFRKYAPGHRFHRYATAFGDINGDGIVDFATFIGDPRYNDNGVEDLKVAVFIGEKDQSFQFREASGEVFAHERVSHDLEIKNQSLILHRDGSGGCCSRWVEEFQFKMRQGQLMLIGLETAEYRPDDFPEVDTGVSADLITGWTINWIGAAGKSRTEKKQKVSALKPVSLHDFDYETFSEKWSRVLWR